MSRGAGSSDSGHERAHDPCRADWHGWSAEHVEPSPVATAPDRTDLAPYAGTGGHSASSFEGRAVQAANLARAVSRHRPRAARAAAWAVLLVVVGATAGVGIWRLLALLT